MVSIPKRVSEVLKLSLPNLLIKPINVSIPKRVSEVLKLIQSNRFAFRVSVSIPKRVSEVLKRQSGDRPPKFSTRFQSLKGFQRF